MAFTTGKDLKALVLSRAGDDAVSPDFGSEVQDYIQASYIGVLSEGFPWTFATKTPPGILTTVAEITAGSVLVTNGLASITFSSAPAVSVAGRKFYVDNEGIVYRILTHTAGQAAATLDANYVGVSGSGLAYHVFQDEYALASDFLRPLGKPFLRDAHGSYDLDLISQDELKAKYPHSWQGGTTARYCAFIAAARIRIAPWPVDARRFEYDYIYHPGTLTFDGGVSDTLIIQPAEDRIVVAFFAAANVMVDMNDDRWSTMAAAGPAKISDMKRLARKILKPRLWMRRQFSLGARR